MPGKTRIRIDLDEILQRAYRLWTDAGQPAGRNLEFFLQAEAELMAAKRTGTALAVAVAAAQSHRPTRALLGSA